ncbi:MAG: GTPase [Pirellulaceae bacterium]
MNRTGQQDESRVCLAACLTPSGRGAIATVVVWGVDARQCVSRFFQPAGKRPLSERPPREIAFGVWGTDDCRGEELVVCCRDDATVEVQCHGGRAAVERILADLASQGCRVVPSSEWITSRYADAVEAAARGALSQATTERTAAILLDQLRGAWRRELTRIAELVEAANQTGREPIEARERLRSLELRSDIGRHLTSPWKVVLAGFPNVGKSLLMNRLLGYERSIVFDQAGTTRDVLSGRTAFDGWPVELLDTAGLRISDDSIELAGVERARRQLMAADLIVLVADARDPMTEARLRDELGLEPLSLRQPFLFVANKSDLLAGTPPVPNSVADDVLLVSALTGEGVSQLMAAIVRRLVPVQLAAGDAVPFTPAQGHQLAEWIGNPSLLCQRGDSTRDIGLAPN